MRRVFYLCHFVFLFFALCVIVNGQDTTLTITKAGNVGIGITNPALRLHIDGGALLEKRGGDVDTQGRLILKTMSLNDPGRFGIRFSNNLVAPFEGEDISDMYFGFFSGWGATRKYDAIIEIHGKSTNDWGRVLRLTHNGTNGLISTDVGNLLLNPGGGTGKVGIGVENPSSKLEVNGLIESKTGGFKFPDGSVQTTASDGGSSGSIWNQVQVSSLLNSTFSDKATITITPPSAGGYFVLTFSGMCYNLSASNETRILLYLNNTANSSISYAGYISYWQDSTNGFTRTIPMHATRIFTNSNTSAKTFYLNAGDNYNGGYTLYGIFIVQWFPG